MSLPRALADRGLIDEYEFLHPVLAGYGPTLLAGLRARIELETRHEIRSGAIALRYRPAHTTA